MRSDVSIVVLLANEPLIDLALDAVLRITPPYTYESGNGFSFLSKILFPTNLRQEGCHLHCFAVSRIRQQELPENVTYFIISRQGVCRDEFGASLDRSCD